jgi:RND superfamily putative drug exporter
MGAEGKRNLDTKIASTGHPARHGAGRDLPIARHYSRRRALWNFAVWLALVMVFSPLAYQFSGRIQSTLNGMQGSQPETVRLNLVKNFSTALAFPVAIVWDAKGIPSAQADALWADVLQTAQSDPNVKDVTDGNTMVEKWPRPDWHAAFIALNAKTYGEAQTAIPILRHDMRTLGFPKGKRPWVTGGPALFLDLNTASTDALRTGELIALPVTFIILLLVFRSLVAALLPVIVAALGVVCTLGILSFLASDHAGLGLHWTAMSVTFFVPNLVTMIGLGVGIDYCLIYLARYRRERANHLTTQEALQVTRRTAGKTVLASAILVMSGFLTLLFIPLDFFKSIAAGGVLVVAIVALATLTLLPAMIFLVGTRLEWCRLSLSFLHNVRMRANFGERWCRMLLSHPRVCVAVGFLLLALLAVPAAYLKTGSIEARNLPAKSEARRGYDSLTQNLGAGWMMPAIVLIQHPSPDWIVGDGMVIESTLVKQFNELDNTAKTLTVSDTTGSRRTQQSRMGLLTSYSEPSQSVILLLSKTDPQSPQARDWLVEVGDILATTEAAAAPRTHYFLGGLPAVTFSADNVIKATLPKVILVTLCSTFLLLLLFMRSLFVAIKAIVLNLLCVLAAYGFQVVCFQYGWGSALLGLHPSDGLNTVVLVICFCALFGLSMDYEVFILSAVRESWLDQHNMRLAVQDGFLRVAGIVFSAAFIMVSVFLSFAFGAVVEIEQLGVGLAFAIMLDATVIRLFLVPCIMVLMGRWAFWCPGQAYPVAERHIHGHGGHGPQFETGPIKIGRRRPPGDGVN